MKIIPLLYIVALLFTSVVWGAVSDIVVGQRAGANQRFVQRVVTGTANPLKPLGFSSDGTFGAIAQIRGVTLGTPDGLSNIDITTNGAIRITANGTNSINTSQRKLFNSTGVEVFDWSSNTLLNNWNVTGSLKVGSEIVTGTPLASNAINTSVALNTKTVSANTVFTFSATPAIGQVFDLEVKNSSGAAVAITIPTSRDSSTGATVTSFTLLASPGRKVVSWRYDGTDYIITQGGAGAGGGEVVSSSTSAIDRLVSFTDTTGKVIKDSGETAASLKARANHTGQQAWNTINGLPTTLAGYGITDGQPLNTNLNSISLLPDPNVDRLLFWDDSDNAWKHLTLGTNLSINGTILNAAAVASGSSGTGSGFPLTGNADFGGYSASNINTIEATNFIGDGSAITDLNAAELIGTIPSISTGLLTTQKARVVTPVAGVANVIVTDNGDTTITLNDATETLTYSNTPPDGTRFEYTLTGQATATTVNIPETYSNALGSLRTSFTVPALKNANIVVKREAGRYVMWGDPVFITDYPANISPTVDGILEVDQNGSTRSTLGQIKSLMLTSPTFSGDSDFGGFNANNINTVNATRFVGDGSGLTLLSANDLVGTIPNITTETLTTARSRVITPVAGVNNVINTNNGDTTITLDAATEQLTYSAQPVTGTRFEYTLTGHTVDSVVSIPSTYSHALGSLRNSFTVPANKNINVIVKREAGRYVMWGDPVSIIDYPINASPTVDGILEVDQGGNSTRSTLGQVKTLMSTSPTFTGVVTNSGAFAYTAAAMAANAIDVTKELNTKTINTSTTFTFFGTPIANQWFGLYVKNTGASAVTVTFPVSKDSVTGADISTASIAATTGRQHLYWRYDGSEYIIYRGSTSSGGGSGDAVLAGGNSWSGDQIVNGNVSANLFTGSGAGLTLLSASELTGTIPDITTETLTTSRSRVVTPVAGVGNVINTNNGDTTITLDAATETLTYSAVPATGTRFEYSLVGHTVDCVVTIPETYSYSTGGLRTSFVVPANKLATIWVKKEATRYVMAGDPIVLSDLPVVTTPALQSLVEVDQGTGLGSQVVTLANVKKTLRVGTKRTGTIATGAAGDATLDFESTDTYIYYVGGTATHTLPDAAANENCTVVYIFNGNYTITLNPDANDFIRFSSTTLADAAGITITGTTGQSATILSDGTNWTTINSTATYSAIQ